MSNSEDIEARLCAYIEGDLDEGGRADIERHLQSHPQHRRLIQELVRTRDMVRALPRAAAPGDLSEMMQGHIERSMLLGSEESDAQMRINRWPQLAALAAVVLLAVGLGLVVFMVLRSSFNHPRSVAVVAGKSEPSEAAQDAVPMAGPQAHHVAGDAVADETAPGQPARFARAMPLQTPASLQSAPAFDSRAVEERLASAGVQRPSIAAPIYMVVSSTDSAAANVAVAGYLTSNSLHYEPIPALESTDTPEQASRRLAMLRNGEAPANGVGGKALDVDHAAAGGGAGDGFTQGTTTGAPNSIGVAGGQMNNAQVARGASSPAANYINGNNYNGANNTATKDEAVALAQQAQQFAAPSPAGKLGNLYVVHHISRQQAADLGKNLARQDPALKCQLFVGAQDKADLGRFDMDALAPTSQPTIATAEPVAAAPVAALADDAKPRMKGQLGKDNITGSGGSVASDVKATPAPDADDKALKTGDLVNIYMNKQLAQNGIEPVQTAIVAADGMIHLHDIGEVPAAGKAPGDLSQSISKAYADKLGDAPTVDVRKVEPTFGGQAGAREMAPGGRVGGGMALPGAPVVDDTVDVVIVINNIDNASPAPTTMPASNTEDNSIPAR